MLIIDMTMPKFCIWCDDKNEPRRCPLLNEDDDCVLQGFGKEKDDEV